MTFFWNWFFYLTKLNFNHPALSLQYVTYVTNITHVTVIFIYCHLAKFKKQTVQSSFMTKHFKDKMSV